MQRKAYHTVCEQLQTKDKSYMLNRVLVQRELGGMLTFAIQTFDKRVGAKRNIHSWILNPHFNSVLITHPSCTISSEFALFHHSDCQ